MRNLHNWSYVSELLRDFRDGAPIERLVAKSRKFLEEGESVEAFFDIVAAVAGIAPQFKEIYDVTFKSQALKAEWARFIYMESYTDPTGRVLKDFKYVDLQNGAVESVKTGDRLTPPARQTWVPVTQMALQHRMHLKKLLNNPPQEEEVPKKWVRPPVTPAGDAKLTKMLEESFKLGKYFESVKGHAKLRSGILCSVDGTFRTNERDWMRLDDCLAQAQNFIDDYLQSTTMEEPVPDPSSSKRKVGSPPDLAAPYSAQNACHTGAIWDEFLQKNKEEFVLRNLKHDDTMDAMSSLSLKNLTERSESKTMNVTQKATALMNNLKTIGSDLLRLQRGRATLHSAKRVIFSVMPIKWGFLTRLTGKAKKIENHPLTDLGLALALHGAASFAVSDVQKREKYLKYTEEMLAAAGVNASMKMLPIEDMLDKVFEGVNNSEAMSKLKEMVKDTGEKLPTNSAE